MKPAVLLTPAARRDLVEIGVYLARESLRAADKVLGSIDGKCRTLSRMPKLGRRRDELAKGLRSLAVGSCVVFYRIIENGVEVIRVLHGARDVSSELS